ncbi:hypothetical protein [Pseudoalteromonas umbrosa]|uniref:hypothetical protein n=1 Tax=Pseudoalteromonas umbrosa TaxID=3048489 RepID=UPI0024C2121D|nr:hypothetical protein [Pseudoalteromonas sp. B95]MDK1290214.1 hypothetical protein [Pseudoalteromonas sp. B95]
MTIPFVEALAWLSMAAAMIAFSTRNEFMLRLFTIFGCISGFIVYADKALVPSMILNAYIGGICTVYILKDLYQRGRTSHPDQDNS